MSDAATDTTRSGRLLSLVRRLIGYGIQLAATLRNPSPNTNLDNITLIFGTRDIARILARITRGLQLAGALEERVIRTAARIDAPPAAPAAARVVAPPSRREPATSRQPRTTPRPVNPRLAQMPSPEQIAAQVRRRPIGVVIGNICRDLGIMRGHPLWDEIRDAVVEFGGDFARLYSLIIAQVLNILKERPCRPTPPASPPATASTGPPLQSAA